MVMNKGVLEDHLMLESNLKNRTPVLLFQVFLVKISQFYSGLYIRLKHLSSVEQRCTFFRVIRVFSIRVTFSMKKKLHEKNAFV